MVAKIQINKFDNRNTIRTKLLVKDWHEETTANGAGFLIINCFMEWAKELGVKLDTVCVYKGNYYRIAQELIKEDYITVFGEFYTDLNKQQDKRIIIKAELISRFEEDEDDDN